MSVPSRIRGRVYVFGDNVNTDVIIPGRYLIHVDPEPLAEHAFEVLGEDFPEKLRRYDVLVAGSNFGCGSAREQAATAIQGLGMRAVVAGSFSRTFYRNAINRGLPIVECPEAAAALHEGDEIEIDLEKGRITKGKETFAFPRLPESIREILELGGLTAYLRAKAWRG